MSIGTLIFFAEGIALYRDRFLIETFSPIMQKTKRSKSRTIHQSLGIIGSLFLGLGLSFVWTSEVRVRHSILPNSIHSCFGFIAITLIVLQIIIGHRKLWDLELKSKSQKVADWHGDFGLLIWDVICLTIISGSVLLLEYHSFLSLVCIVVNIFISWFALHLQMRRKGPDSSVGNVYAFSTAANINGNPSDDMTTLIHQDTNNNSNIHNGISADDNDDFDI